MPKSKHRNKKKKPIQPRKQQISCTEQPTIAQLYNEAISSDIYYDMEDLTAINQAETEYQQLIDKVYSVFDRLKEDPEYKPVAEEIEFPLSYFASMQSDAYLYQGFILGFRYAVRMVGGNISKHIEKLYKF